MSTKPADVSTLIIVLTVISSRSTFHTALTEATLTPSARLIPVVIVPSLHPFIEYESVRESRSNAARADSQQRVKEALQGTGRAGQRARTGLTAQPRNIIDCRRHSCAQCCPSRRYNRMEGSDAIGVTQRASILTEQTTPGTHRFAEPAHSSRATGYTRNLMASWRHLRGRRVFRTIHVDRQQKYAREAPTSKLEYSSSPATISTAFMLHHGSVGSRRNHKLCRCCAAQPIKWSVPCA